MADAKKKTQNVYERFGSDDRATNAKGRGLIDVRPPRKNRKPLPPQKTSKK